MPTAAAPFASFSLANRTPPRHEYRDPVGLERAQCLKPVVDPVVAGLSAENLPATITVETPETVKHPFK